jgi:hypothetical protein
MIAASARCEPAAPAAAGCPAVHRRAQALGPPPEVLHDPASAITASVTAKCDPMHSRVCRKHYEKVGIGAAFVDSLMR